MRSLAFRMMLAVTVVLGLASLAAAQTGNEEAICRNDPNVFFCENFEDRAAMVSAEVARLEGRETSLPQIESHDALKEAPSA